MLLSITSAEVVGPFELQLTFNDGVAKQVDLAAHWQDIQGPIFAPLRDEAFFNQVTLPLDSETIEWPNGADLAAEYLYEIGTPINTAVTRPASALATAS